MRWTSILAPMSTALGVLLYELMTGTTPLERHRLQKDGLAEILRCIREDDPPKLKHASLQDRKARLHRRAAQHGTDTS